MTYVDWCKSKGYECLTPFWGNFIVAETLGVADPSLQGSDAVKYAFRGMLKSAKGDYQKLTELIMVLNHRERACKERGDIQLARTYLHLFGKAKAAIIASFTPPEKQYYLNTVF